VVFAGADPRLRGRSTKRAFEVEHTTSVYFGILRARREKVFQEIRRPVFSLLEPGPLSENCTFISYESVRELADEQHLEHLADAVLDEYEEEAEG
jgi:hypothetical protein